MMRKKKIVQPAIDTNEEATPEPAKVEVIEPQPVTLTTEQRLNAMEQRFAQNEKEIENAFAQLIQRLQPIIELSDKVAKAEETKQAGVQPITNSADPMAAFQKAEPLIRMFAGEQSNPLQDKLNQYYAQFLDRTFDRMMQPSKFEQFFEEEIAKAKAKAMAAAVST